VLRFAVVAATSLAAAALAYGATSRSTSESPRVLLFTKTAGFRHSSIPVAVTAIREGAARSGLEVAATEDGAEFTDTRLHRYDAVVFLLTTGDVLNDAQQAAFERFVRRGGGFAGVHSASDTEYDWPWYGRLVGAHFRNHPAIQPARVRIQATRDPSTAGLPRSWTRTDEWYNLARNPRGSARVLATVDESSYAPGPGAMGADHPTAWAHTFDGGRAWYTAGGHTEESYSDPLFLRHLIGGIRYAAGLSPPRIRGVRLAVRQRRVAATVGYTACRPCRGRLVVSGRSTSLRFDDGLARATSKPQRAGKRAVTVVLEDPLTRIAATARRTVFIH
jgi:type 1 glutamine amidotransferase